MENAIPEVFLPVKDYIVHLEDFDLVKMIGRGSYGEVYYAIHKTTGTKTALKKLLFDELDEVQLEYFIREVLILAYYNNFFLVSFLGFSPTNPYLIVTEFVPCGSLYDSLHGRPGSPILSGTDKTKIAIGIIEGMICLHTNKIIHRDLKSLNILLDEHKLPKICDFGISRAIDEENQVKMTLRIGTYHWMAPEMLDSDNYNYKVDVYAFSIMLWEMLTSQVPYQGLDPLKILINVKNNGMRPSIPSDCNENLAKLMARCWDQEPDNRPTFCELYEIFRDQNVHFNDTNTEEIRQFFEQFPISDDILHPKATDDNKDIINKQENNNFVIPETNNKEEITNEEFNNEDTKYEEMNNENDLNDINNDINDDINITPAGMNNKSNRLNFNTEPEKDLYHSEEEIKSTNKNQLNLASDHYKTQQRKTQESLTNYNLHKSNTLHTVDNSSNESFKEKDKKKDKKKDKTKSKNEKEKEKKKEEKKKRKTDADAPIDHNQNLRKMKSNAAFEKKLNDEYPDLKRHNQPDKAPISPNKAKKPITSFDRIFDIELREMKKRNIPISNCPISNIDIHHNRQKLNNNIFSEFVDSIEEEKYKLPYIVQLHDFERFKNQIYTSDKINIFLNPDRFQDVKDIQLKETEIFVIDDNVFKNFANSSNSRRSSKISTTPTSPNRKSSLLIESSGTSFEEEEIIEEENIENMLRQSSGRGKLINIFKAELDEITLENSIEVFNDLKNLFQQRFRTNDDRRKDDVYIFLLANSLKDKGELINQFNDINGFDMLPITGNFLITPAFVTLFSVCILFDIKRFPFKVFNDVFVRDSNHNTGKFLLMLQALDSAIQNNIFNDVKDIAKIKDAFTKILGHFFENKKYYQEFNEFPQFLFSIYTKLITLKGIFNDTYLFSIRYQLIEISINIITLSTDIKCLKTAFSVLLSKQVDSIPLFESQNIKNFQFPLRSILSLISSRIKQPETVTYQKSELVPYVSSFFAHFQRPPISSTLVTVLCEDALFSSSASSSCLTLCRIAKTSRGALLLAEKSTIWIGKAVSEVEKCSKRLKEIKKSVKDGLNLSDVKNEIIQEAQNVSCVAESSSLCLRIILTLFISHVSAIDNLSKQAIFLKFLDSIVTISRLQSLCKENSSIESDKNFVFLVDSLRSVFTVLRRIKVKFLSAERLNDSKILSNLSKYVLARKIVEKSPKAAELALQIVDLLVRAAENSSKEEGKSLVDDLDFVQDFVNHLPSLLVIGGAVSHKAIIASISVFILQKNSVTNALKNEPNIKFMQSKSAVDFNNINNAEFEDCHTVSMLIRKILLKIDLISGFEKYRNTLIDILAKNE